MFQKNLKSLLPRPKYTFSRVSLVATLILFLLGYHPAVGFPPLKKVEVFGHETPQHEITAENLPSIQLPHPGYLSTRFSRRHTGVDIATGLGMPIHPITDGVVKEVNFGFSGYGNNVVLSHQAGLQSLYGHLDRVYVKIGQIVKSQDTLGTVGLTGWTSGPHTHLEITREGKFIDPLTILPKMQDYPSEEYLRPYGGSVNRNSAQNEVDHVKLNPTIAPLTNNLPLNSTDRPTSAILFSLPINKPFY